MSQIMPDPISDATDTLRTNYVGFASFMILVWDHLITFSDEYEYIWKGKKGLIIYLFFFNRYFTPLGFIVNLFAYLSPSWTHERCAHFIRYEGATVAIAVEVVGLMMLLRIHALYSRHKVITWGLAMLLIIETAVNAWLISRGEPVLHSDRSGVHACTMIFDPDISVAASASAWIPLLYDTLVFGLTIYRALPSLRTSQAGYLISRITEDGLLYYSVIFSVTLILTIMIIAAPPGTKNICAQMEQLLTVAMMSRITISLRRAGHRAEKEPMIQPKSFFFKPRARTTDDLWPERRTFNNSRMYSEHILAPHSSPLATSIQFANSAVTQRSPLPSPAVMEEGDDMFQLKQLLHLPSPAVAR